MNTVIGFACAIGIDMGFNSSHHENDIEVAEQHLHGGGHYCAPDHYGDKDKDHHEKKDGDDCCNGKVIKFNEVDKSLQNSLTATISPVSLPVFIVSNHKFELFYTSNITSIKYFVRSYHPPGEDIRIHIQSFQI